METVPCPLCGSIKRLFLIKTATMMQDGAGGITGRFDKCINCGFIYLNPRVSAADIHFFYQPYYLPYLGSRVWGKYAWIAEIGAKRELLKRVSLVEKLIQNPEASVLDVGCGKPDFLSSLLHKKKWELTGMDFDDSSWQDSKYDKLDLRSGDLAEIDFDKTKKIDLITMWHYLEHDYDPGKTLKKLLSVAHSETRLVVEVPNYNSFTRRWQKENWEGFHTPRHIGIYSPETLKKMLEAHGWKIERQYTFGSLDPFVLWWMGERERKKLKWNKSMEADFLGFMFQRMISWPFFGLQRWISLGVQTAIAVPAYK